MFQNRILGWAPALRAFVYAAGGNWSPRDDGECFEVCGRDKDHPQIGCAATLTDRDERGLAVAAGAAQLKV